MLRLLDPLTAADETLHWMHELRVQAQLEAAPDEPTESRESYVGRFRHPVTTGLRYIWVIGGVGYATLDVDDESPAGFVRIYVGSAHRRRGAGRELADMVVHQARAVGCPTVTSLIGTEAGAGLVKALGGRVAGSVVRSVLTLPARVAPAAAPGYTLRSWPGATPDDLLETVARARDAIADAPFEGGLNAEAWTPARVRDLERASAERGQELRLTVVLAGDRAVAVTVVRVDAPPATTAFTEDTAVVQDHRGKGLALLVKAESLRMLASQRPDVVRVSTSNHETNAAMLAVNRRLGFVPVSRWTSVYLDLENR